MGDANRMCARNDSPGGSTGPGAKSDVYDWLVIYAGGVQSCVDR